MNDKIPGSPPFSLEVWMRETGTDYRFVVYNPHERAYQAYSLVRRFPAIGSIPVASAPTIAELVAALAQQETQ